MFFRILFATVAVLSGPCYCQAREWTNTQGKTVAADIVSADAGSVTLKLSNGSTPTVKLDTLIQSDQDFVKKWLAEQAASPAGKTGPADKTGGNGGIQDSKANKGLPVGFDGAWPDEARVPDELNIEIVKEDDASKIYIYRSTHFEFNCNVQLKKRLVSACAKVFEATHEYLRLLPLNHKHTAPGKNLFPVHLFETMEQYYSAGGMRGSAGVCISSGESSKVLVPLVSFGVKKLGKDYTVDAKSGDWHVLSHEITHQIMENRVKEATWYTEGSAEYVGCTPYTGGRFKISTNRTAILAFLTDYGKDNKGGRNLGKDIKMVDMKTFMTMPQDKFLTDANTNYALGCMLTYYFYHLDGEGDAARMKAYVKALQDGTRESDARELLLDGRTYSEMGDAFAKGMRRYGIKIKLAPSPDTASAKSQGAAAKG